MVARRDDDKPFLSRWSQRKRQAEEAAREPEAAAAQEVEPAGALEEEEIDPAQLPEIDSLDAGSDFTVFMRKGVPNALKQKALRRLWQVDPAFKHICMLDDYNQDFTDAAMVVPNLKTIYQVGRGMVLPEEEELEKARVAEVSAPSGDDPPEPAAAGEPRALLASPADVPRQEEEQRDDFIGPGPGTATALADSGRAVEKSSTRAPLAGGSRPARRRRWGDVEG